MQSDSLARSAVLPKPRWQQALRQAFRDPAELLDFLGLPPEPRAAPALFPMRVPRRFARRMEYGNRHDPLLLQVLPESGEMEAQPGFCDDPVGDRDSRQTRGVLHKYHGRVLLVATGACAVHCRYCFRQAFPYQQERASADRWQPAVDYVAANGDIEEVILSGGDPLMLPTVQLRRLSDSLAPVGHLRRLRIHSRLPVVLPERIDDRLCRWLAELPWPAVMVIHANHPNEFDSSVDAALSRLRRAGVQVLNQAVLLAGINDQAATLAGLMRRSFAAGALPYYLHQLDRVTGAARFEVEDRRAVALVETLRRELSGYLVPRLVRERAGVPYKTPIL